jgi:hypothetical protein
MRAKPHAPSAFRKKSFELNQRHKTLSMAYNNFDVLLKVLVSRSPRHDAHWWFIATKGFNNGHRD